MMVHPNFVRKQLSKYIYILLGTVCVVNVLAIMKYYIHGPKRTGAGNRATAAVGPPTHNSEVYLHGTTPAQNVVVITQPKNELRGSLNVHHWYPICGNTVDSLRRHVLFPKHPKIRTAVTDLHIRTKLLDFGQRIFGYVHPPLSGSYQFSVSSCNLSEVWLSSDESPNNVNLICKVAGFTKDGEFNKSKAQTSQKISLSGSEKYFFEVLHKQARKQGFLHVTWKIPGWTNFRKITSEFISLFMKEERDQSLYKRDDHEPLPEMILEYRVRTKYPRPSPYSKYTRLPIGSDIELLRHSRAALPTCRRFVFTKNLKRYEGTKFAQISSVFPQDGSNLVLKNCDFMYKKKYKNFCQGNPVLKKEIAYAVAEKYLNVSFPGRFILKSVIRLEKVLEKPTHDYRYFIEIEVIDKNSSERARIVDHVVESHVNGKLCYRTETTWSPDVIVYVIMTIKNQGDWLRHAVDNLVEIQEQTNDENIHLIIVDFGSQDVDIDIYLKRSGLKNYTVIHKKGKFFKTAAINEAAASVKDNNSIIFQLDLHLDLPINLFQTLRKHTIQGDLAFAPILFRLVCGSTPDYPNGHWQGDGFGLFAIYKSDWIRFGGMNEKEFSNRWGGEDWEMMDRVIMANIRVQKLNMPGLFHFFHNRRSLWDKAA